MIGFQGYPGSTGRIKVLPWPPECLAGSSSFFGGSSRPGLVDELAERFSPRGGVLDLDAYRSLRRGPHQQQFIPAKPPPYMAGIESVGFIVPEDPIHNIAVIS